MGDASATATLFSRIIAADENKNILKTATRLNPGCTLPPSLPSEVYKNLPFATGVYYFHDEQGKVIYVGKAKEIRKRVQQHFSGAAGAKIDFQERIYNITYRLTGTELIALLLESNEIKRLWPFYNRMQKTLRGTHALLEYVDGNGIRRLGLRPSKNGMQSLTTFKNFQEGRRFLQRLCDEDGLCPKCCGLQHASGACFDYSLHKCRGVCAGKEDKNEYNERVGSTLALRLGELETHVIMGAGRNDEEKSVVLIEQGGYKGFGFCPPEKKIETPRDCYDVIESYPDTPDVRKILRWYFSSSQEVSDSLEENFSS